MKINNKVGPENLTSREHLTINEMRKSRFINPINFRKNIISLLILLFLTSYSIYAQGEGPISKGQVQLNAGLGFSGWGVPIYIALDYGVNPDITIGVELSNRNYNENFLGSGYSHSITGISGNCNYHFSKLLDIPYNLDIYAGLNLGFYIWNTSASYLGSGSSGLGLGAQIGGRYYFNDNWGINLELGGANTTSGSKIGASYRF